MELEMTDDQSSASQYVYVLSNESMPGIYKVGMTTSSPQRRMDELYTTGVPTPFNLEVSIAVIEARDSEKSAHKSLTDYRVSGRREFFQGDLAEIVATVLSSIDLYRIEYVRKPELLTGVNSQLAKHAERKAEFVDWLQRKRSELQATLINLERRYDKLLQTEDRLKGSRIPEAGYCHYDHYRGGRMETSGPGFVRLDMRRAADELKSAIEEIERISHDQDALDKAYEKSSSWKDNLFAYQIKEAARNYESDFREQLFMTAKGWIKRRRIRTILDESGIHTASGQDPKYVLVSRVSDLTHR